MEKWKNSKYYIFLNVKINTFVPIYITYYLLSTYQHIAGYY